MDENILNNFTREDFNNSIDTYMKMLKNICDLLGYKLSPNEFFEIERNLDKVFEIDNDTLFVLFEDDEINPIHSIGVFETKNKTVF